MDFEALDGRPVHLIIMALIPQTSTLLWLQLMKEAEMVKDKRFMDSIASAKSSGDMLGIIAEMERKLFPLDAHRQESEKQDEEQYHQQMR